MTTRASPAIVTANLNPASDPGRPDAKDPSPMAVDQDSDYFANTQLAHANRQAKAKAIARHLYEQAISADTARNLPEDERRAVVRACDYPNASDLTWGMVVDLLEQRAAWDAAHPPAPTESGGPPTPTARQEACVYAYRGCTGTGRSRGGHAPRCPEHDIHGGVYPGSDPERTLVALLERAATQRATARALAGSLSA